MNRRGFISMLAGAAGAPLVPWRGLIESVIVLPGLIRPTRMLPELIYATGTYQRYSGFETLNIEPAQTVLSPAVYRWIQGSTIIDSQWGLIRA